MKNGKTEIDSTRPGSLETELAANKDPSSSAPAATLSEAQRLAAVILECLAGVRAPPAASELLGISLPRYYQLEARALEGLVAALAPRPKGKQPSLEIRVRTLEKDLEAALRACARQEALVRVTQRSLGLAALTKSAVKPTTAEGKRRKSRRPQTRAMRAAKVLRAKADAKLVEVGPVGSGEPVPSSLQPVEPSTGPQEARQ